MKTRIGCLHCCAVVYMAMLCGEISQAAIIDRLAISEVFYDARGPDDGLEWVELYKGSDGLVDLGDWSLGFAGSSYHHSTVALSGQLQPGHYFVVGGPLTGSTNGAPVFDLPINFAPDLQNSGSIADGVALFALPAKTIEKTSLPFDAVIYGGSNTNSLVDRFGHVTTVHVEDAASGHSIERIGTERWLSRDNPQPGSGVLARMLHQTGTGIRNLSCTPRSCERNWRVCKIALCACPG